MILIHFVQETWCYIKQGTSWSDYEDQILMFLGRDGLIKITHRRVKITKPNEYFVGHLIGLLSPLNNSSWLLQSTGLQKVGHNWVTITHTQTHTLTHTQIQHRHTHTNTQKQTQTHTDTHTDTHTHRHIHRYTHRHTHTDTYPQIHTDTHIQRHTHIHTHKHIHRYTHTDTHTDTHRHTHTHVCLVAIGQSLPWCLV